MTENEWNESARLSALFAVIEPRKEFTARKARLYSVAACRHIWHLLPNERSHNAVLVSERYADDEATAEELKAVKFAIRETSSRFLAGMSVGQLAASAARHAAGLQRIYSTWHTMHDALRAATMHYKRFDEDRQTNEARFLANLLREIVGCLPFRAPNLPAAVLAGHGELLRTLAQAAYDERHLPSGELDRDRLAILADALEEAGAVGEVVDHLRGPGPHVRGCYVVDLVLGRE